MDNQMYVVLRRKQGAEKWDLVPHLFPSHKVATEDAQERFVKNRTFNEGKGYEYQVCSLTNFNDVISGGGRTLSFEAVVNAG